MVNPAHRVSRFGDMDAFLAILDFEDVVDFLLDHKYVAMFGFLFLCGLGLPVPEEVTLVGSGLLVGWKEANFWISSVVCVTAIIAGDSMIFFLGRHYGQRFLRSRPMRLLFSPRKQRKVRKLFERNSSRAVFFARFFAGVRIGMYAYAGSHKMSWFRFALLDLLGALISGPTSIWLGEWAGQKFASDKEEAVDRAREYASEFQHWLILVVVLTVTVLVTVWFIRRRRSQSNDAAGAPGNNGRSVSNG